MLGRKIPAEHDPTYALTGMSVMRTGRNNIMIMKNQLMPYFE
jgi:hypothetical protein